MNKRQAKKLVPWLIASFCMGSASAGVLTTAFTYQGLLKQNGQPANAVYDMRFSLHNALSGGSPVGSPLIFDGGSGHPPPVTVADGLFTVALDFGGVFTGTALWLEIAVRPAGGGAYTTLTPRQPLTATPFALYALNGPGAAFWAATGSDIYNTNSGHVGIGTATPDGLLGVVSDASDGVSKTVRITRNGTSGSALIAEGPFGAAATSDCAVIYTNTQGDGLEVVNDGSGRAGFFACAGVAGDFSGMDNNGTNAALKVRSGSQTMLFDGNEIDSNGDLYLNHNSTSNVILDGGGNLGIGTTSPVARLYVLNGTGTQSALHCAQASTGNSATLSILNANSTANTVHATTLGKGSAGFFQISNSGSTADALYCTTSGNGRAFHANGPARIAISEPEKTALSVSAPAWCEGEPEGFIVCHGYAINATGPIASTDWVIGSVKSFRIDHPLDPENRYLMHTCIESSDMKNLYDGTAVLDEHGEAWVSLPDWFEALNGDFRYQLTCIGGHAPVFIAHEIENGRFQIGGGRAGLKVSWQVTGIRQDVYARTHRVPVEPFKSAAERGRFVHPELYGHGPEKGINYEPVAPASSGE